MTTTINWNTCGINSDEGLTFLHPAAPGVQGLGQWTSSPVLWGGQLLYPPRYSWPSNTRGTHPLVLSLHGSRPLHSGAPQIAEEGGNNPKTGGCSEVPWGCVKASVLTGRKTCTRAPKSKFASWWARTVTSSRNARLFWSCFICQYFFIFFVIIFTLVCFKCINVVCILAFKVVYNYRELNSPAAVCFVDIKRAFDSISYNHLHKLTERRVIIFISNTKIMAHASISWGSNGVGCFHSHIEWVMV